MKMITMSATIIFLLIIVLISILNIVSKKSFIDMEKNSPFECGFDPKNLARLPFSLHFFLIAIIFIIFDVELALLLPYIIMFKSSDLTMISLTMMIILTILIVGIYHEKKEGALNWSI
uniref:NADH-ubiquinone oxidoreductase chain 3 n=1 Tax=Xyloterini sp. TaxID=2995406 RepID=A0A9E8G3Q8_9CUCU|nr:NADH dehydrogenase subunit 3 [Xyloterini sp.]